VTGGRRTPVVVAALLAALAPACSGAGDGPPPIDAPPRDAPPPCQVQSLEIGRCQVPDGTPCIGDPVEVRTFAPLAPGGDVALVTGPQGASMLVFSIRTTGVVPGNPADPVDPTNPLVELVVAQAGLEVAVYRGRAGLADDGGGNLTAVGLFVIADGSGLADASLIAHGHLTDAAGAERCGEIDFVARRWTGTTGPAAR